MANSTHNTKLELQEELTIQTCWFRRFETEWLCEPALCRRGPTFERLPCRWRCSRRRNCV